jgi:hypothetical protein
MTMAMAIKDRYIAIEIDPPSTFDLHPSPLYSTSFMN